MKRKRINPDWIIRSHVLRCWMVLCIISIMIGIWTIDISVSAQSLCDPDIIMTNGWWARDPIQQYHLGLYLTILASFMLIMASFLRMDTVLYEK